MGDLMDWSQEYKQKLRKPKEAMEEQISSGDSIYAGGATVAKTTLEALFQIIDEGKVKGIILNAHSPVNGLDLSKYSFTREQLTMDTFFMNPPDRAMVQAGKAFYMPLQYGMYKRYIDHVKPNVSIILMSPPDENGYMNIGPFGFHPAALASSKKIIAQVSKYVPRVNGTAHRYHVSEVAAIVEADDPMGIVNNPEATEIEKKISEHILEYIPDGACIQLGIGGIANAVGFGLKDKKHLGIHSEVLTESIVDLMEAGVVDNSCKAFKPGQTTLGFVLGTERQYQFIDQNKDLLFCGFEDIVNIKNIASNKNMISINAAISVDLTGQVCAESIGHREYSGTGGQLDFVRGASLSEGGCSFIAMPSTSETKNGRVSRIVLELLPGSIVTTPRTDVQYIVTEYGCVNLMFSNVADRVKKLISIAHPDFRKELTFGAKQAGLII